MNFASTLMLVSFWIAAGILMLLWSMPCALLANRGEKQGLSFSMIFLLSFILTPIAGLVFLSAARSNRTTQVLRETASRT
jgi:hypothetical protein